MWQFDCTHCEVVFVIAYVELPRAVAAPAAFVAAAGTAPAVWESTSHNRKEYMACSTQSYNSASV